MVRHLNICVFACLLLAVAAEAASEYEVVILHPPGFTATEAYGISDGQQVGHGWGSNTGGQTHALLWSGTTTSYVDLNPSWSHTSFAYDVSDGRQVGQARGEATFNQPHAMLWSGTAASYVDLHPPEGYLTWSSANGISGDRQVGSGVAIMFRACLWSGTAASFIDLTPAYAGTNGAGASDVFGDQQVGAYASGLYSHAALWSGTAESCVDLNPSGFDESGATSTSGNQQVGSGRGPATDGYTHALLWSGTSASCVDLHPTGGFDTSIAYDVAGGLQVGHAGVIGSYAHAVVWSGTASSYVDLHNFLPPGYSDSYAQGIDSEGNIVGYARSVGGYHHAVMWVESTQPPEPLQVSIDIIPRCCPNRLNVKSKGSIEVAVLGKEDFDVTNTASATLEGVAPFDLDLFDTTTPIGTGAGACECIKGRSARPDGFMDLVLYFDAQEIVAALGSVNDGDVVELTMTGELADGTPIDGKDCIVIRSKGKH